MNLTDVDAKTIERSQKESETLKELTEFYTDAFFKNLNNIQNLFSFAETLRDKFSKNKLKMLIEFTVGNYLSLKEKKTLSMEAAAIKDHPGNVIHTGKYKLLRSAVIYGANSSGKSNFIKAMNKMGKLR